MVLSRLLASVPSPPWACRLRPITEMNSERSTSSARKPDVVGGEESRDTVGKTYQWQ